jgi:hypothetical protein
MKKTMTKAAMIAEMQLRDARAWLELKQAEQRYGHEDEFVGTMRARWATINEVMTSLGIQTDHTLWDNQEATRIIVERIRG